MPEPWTIDQLMGSIEERWKPDCDALGMTWSTVLWRQEPLGQIIYEQRSHDRHYQRLYWSRLVHIAQLVCALIPLKTWRYVSRLLTYLHLTYWLVPNRVCIRYVRSASAHVVDPVCLKAYWWRRAKQWNEVVFNYCIAFSVIRDKIDVTEIKHKS